MDITDIESGERRVLLEKALQIASLKVANIFAPGKIGLQNTAKIRGGWVMYVFIGMNCFKGPLF